MKEKDNMPIKKERAPKGRHGTDKLTVLYILEIIRDAGLKGIIKKDIHSKLVKVYGQKMTEKTLGEYLPPLLTAEKIRLKENSKTVYVLNEGSLNTEDLDILEDLVTYSRCLDKTYVKDLLKKISTLRVGKRMINREYLAERLLRTNNVNILENIRIIREAIANKKQIQIFYKNGKEYSVSPYELIIYNSVYYLVCHYEGRRDEVSREKLETRRLDRIESIKIKRKASVDYKDVVSNSSTAEFDIADYISKRIYPMSGDEMGITMKIHSSAEETLRENFSDILILSRSIDILKVRINTNKKSFVPWYVAYSWIGEVVTEELREEIREYAQSIANKYKVTKLDS